MPRRLPPITDVAPLAAPLRVVGDVHLGEAYPAVADAFVGYLDSLVGTGGSLVLLGDVFEVWIGRPMQTDPLPRRVLAALKRLIAAGTTVKFMLGNRDIGFRGADGFDAEIWPDPVRMRLDGRTVVLTHGDQLCTADLAYQAMRRFFYGPGGQLLARLPYRAKHWLGTGVRRLSRRETGRKQGYTMGLDYGEALRWLDAYGGDVLVAGHVHTGVHHRHPGPPDREILVLKDWERGGSVIRWDGHALQLVPPMLE